MTLSIEVLPAPFGPMMARTSPFLMSNDTPRIARTPPNDSETSSTESNTSPAAISLAAGALIPQHHRFPPSPGGGGSTRKARRGGVTLQPKKAHPHPASHSASKTRVNALVARRPPP